MTLFKKTSPWFLFLLFILGIGLYLKIPHPHQFPQNPQQTLSVSKIVDGDTIELENGKRVRYIGVDTPEFEECYFEEAKKLNSDLVLNKEVRLEFDVNDMDQYGRLLAYVFVGKDNAFVNKLLLQKGAGKFFLDTVNLKYQKDFVVTAEDSHQEKQGLWQKCAEDPKAGCVVKGNYSRTGPRYYHLPSFRHYPATVVNLESGDQWFCSEKEAVEAGFLRARE